MTNRKKQIVAGFATLTIGVGAIAGAYGVYQYITTQSDKEKVNNSIKDNDYYNNLTDKEKGDFEQKLNDLVESGYYKGLSEEEKDEIVDKLVESEKIQKEVKEEQEKTETRKEELKQELEDLSSNKQELEQRVQDLKDSGATDEEIKAAESEQQKVEEQIKAAEQEQTYYEVIDSAKDGVQSDASKHYEENFSIKQINGIYAAGVGNIMIDVDIVQIENIGGKEFHVQNNCLLRFESREYFNSSSSSEDIIKGLSQTSVISMEKCVNLNATSHFEFFENENNNMDCLSNVKKSGFTLSLIKSWGEDEHPRYIVKAQKGEKEITYLLSYNKDKNKYVKDQIQKICPEFWAQLEAEQAEEQNENLKNRSEFATLDEEGNTISFDYSAYLSKTKQQNTSVQETENNYLFSDELER